MHQICKFVMGMAAVAALSTIALVEPAQTAQAQTAAPATEKKWKDQAEYGLYEAANKETDANKKLQILDQWKSKYPETDYRENRLLLYIDAYRVAGQLPKVLEACKELLTLDPKNVTALFWITTFTPIVYPQNAPADALDTGEKAANSLLKAEAPPGTKPEDWKTAKSTFDPLAHKVLGWVALQRKNYDVAEKEFRQALELNPKQAETSMWLGTALRTQKTPEGQSAALFAFARSVALDPKDGGLPDALRQQMESYLQKAYTQYHGQDEAGLKQLKEQARTMALPPPGFVIKTKDEIETEREAKEKAANPAKALWTTLKTTLQGEGGQQYFDSSLKGAGVPGGAEGVKLFRGTIIEAKPAARSKELVLGILDPSKPEVTLKLDTALKGKPVIGSTVEFEGVPSSFTKEPFMVTFDVETEKLVGLQEEKIAPAATKKSAGKKGGAKKK